MPGISVVGYVENWILEFEIGSFTNPKLVYTARVDFSEGTGWCSCMDASCRKNRSSRLNRPAPVIFECCKHIRFIWQYARRKAE